MAEWFEEWFRQDYLLIYKNRNSKDAEKQFQLVEKQNFLKKDSKILDLGCGDGRYLQFFYQNGYSNVLGIDISSFLLEKALLKNKNFSLQKCDMRKFNGIYDVIFSFFTSFGYFDDKENYQLLERIYSHIELNGYFWLDYFNSYYLENNLEALTVREINQKKITEKREIMDGRVTKKIYLEDLENFKNLESSTIKKNNKKEFKESVAFYSSEKLKNFFSSIGFKVLEIFGDYEGNPFEKNISKRIIFLLQK